MISPFVDLHCFMASLLTSSLIMSFIASFSLEEKTLIRHVILALGFEQKGNL